MKTHIATLILTALIGCTAFGSAEAGPWGRHRAFVGGYFGPHDVVIWRGGGWRHGWYGGRFGWWWVVGGAWYFYNAPIYPYPDPYVPAAYVAASPAPAVAPAPQYWYWCAASKAYYPYVDSCESGWQPVPANQNPAPKSP